MSNILVINGHQYYPFSEGKLNATLVDTAVTLLQNKGYKTHIVTMQENIDVEQQLALHQWADAIIFQSPINWMGVTWSFKKYMDEVYTAGMAGTLCQGDGRSASTPTEGYGSGGVLKGKKYMMSITLNAPKQAFNNTAEFFDGKSVDDLLFPMHMNFKFFNLTALPTFACFDVMKNEDIENDLALFTTHINKHF